MSLATAKTFAAAAYPLDEASGSAIDAVGSVDLTDNNTVGSATGLLHTARDFERGDAEAFSHADDAALSGGGDQDYTICGYIKPESLTDGMGFVAKWGGGQSSYLLRFVNSGGIKIQGFYSADGSSATSCTGTTTIPTGSVTTFAWVQDSTANEVRLYINGTEEASTGHSGGVFDGTATFYIGNDGGGDTYDGLAEEIVLLKGYAFTDADAVEHYNGGAGVAFADWDGGGPAFIDNTTPILRHIWSSVL